MEKVVYDYIVLGGGSGGVASSRWAAGRLGKKVAIIEKGRLGGTCVNVGCVPKKIMWNTANLFESFHQEAAFYGFQVQGETHLDYKLLKQRRTDYITRLNGIYANMLKNSGVQLYQGVGHFVDAKTIQVGDQLLTADHITIAVGGTPTVPAIPGAELGITSDGFFDEMSELPKRAAVVGAGYIAVELAGVLQTLGSSVDLVIRYDKFLRNFDNSIADNLMPEMTASGINIKTNTSLGKVEKNTNGTLTLYNDKGEVVGNDYNTIIWAIGRHPLTSTIGLDKIGVQLNPNHTIKVDEYSNTSVPGIYAIGDVIGKLDLTPVAIAAGRRLARRLFEPNQTTLKLDYSNVPTVIFSHPPVGTVGISEKEAKEKFGEDQVHVHTTSFTNMYYAFSIKKPKTYIKMVTVGPQEKVVGLHIIGIGADEMLQGFAVAIKMGATRKDFNDTIAIHPTASEEVVLL